MDGAVTQKTTRPQRFDRVENRKQVETGILFLASEAHVASANLTFTPTETVETWREPPLPDKRRHASVFSTYTEPDLM